MEDNIYNTTAYSKVIQSKKMSEDYINQLYASFENMTFQQKIGATVEINLLRDIIFELDKYMIAYQQNAKTTNTISEYVVIYGDTLPGIASKVYKDHSKWVDIFKYNELSDTLLEAGTILKLPEVR